GAHLAQTLEMRRMVVPPVPGLFSALGLLCSPQEHHYARTFWRRFVDATPAEAHAVLQRLIEEARRDLAAEGFPSERVSLEAFADIRYASQNSELSIPVGSDASLELDFRA